MTISLFLFLSFLLASWAVPAFAILLMSRMSYAGIPSDLNIGGASLIGFVFGFAGLLVGIMSVALAYDATPDAALSFEGLLIYCLGYVLGIAGFTGVCKLLDG